MTTVVKLGGLSLPIRVRSHPRSNRMTLRVDPAADALLVVVPPWVGLADALAFVEARRDWIQQRLERMPPRVPFVDGAMVPIGGRPHRIRHLPEARRGVWREAGEILVSGQADFIARRVRAHLTQEARAAILPLARDFATRLDRRLGRVSLRDTRSRWGSCSASGDLSFSWRLILAPEEVLTYVVAHEAAHLREMNHGARFWRLVEGLSPGTGAPRAWLRRHGASLHRFG